MSKVNSTPEAKPASVATKKVEASLETLVLNVGDLLAYHVSAENPEAISELKDVATSKINSIFCAFITTPIENKSGYGNVADIIKTAKSGNPADTFDVYYLPKGKENAPENRTLITSMTRENLLKRAEIGKVIENAMQESADLAPMLVNLVRDVAGKTGKKAAAKTFTI